MEPLRIEMLGGLRVIRGSTVVTHLETRRASVLLAWLALHLGKPCPREVLAEMLWPDEDVDAVRGRPRQVLSSLRRELAPEGEPEDTVLVADRAEVRLRADRLSTDVTEFETLLSTSGQAEAPADRAEHLKRAVALYQGELLPGYAEECLAAPRRPLAEAFRQALISLAQALSAAGDVQAAIPWAERAVADDPLREDAHCGLMRLYAAAGRRADALRQYHELERILREELATAPSPATAAVLNEILCTEGATAPARATSNVSSRSSAPRRGAGLEPAWSSLMINSTPQSPRSKRLFRNECQCGSCSDRETETPRISRRPDRSMP